MLTISEFTRHWKRSGGSKRANYALFLTELTEVLGVEKSIWVRWAGSVSSLQSRT